MDDQKRINELYEKAIKSMREYSAHDVKKIRDITNGVFVRMIEKDAVLNNDGWIPLIFKDGGLRCFQIMSVSNDIRTRRNFDDVYPWDDSITHWMELPDMPDVPGVIFGDEKYWED